MSYHSPTDLMTALKLKAQPGGLTVAGGTDVYPSAQQGISPQRYLDITRIDGLRGITTDADAIRIGAATTWSDIVKANLPPAFEGLKQAAREVGSVQIQNAATIAGNLCNASPAADGVPPLLTLDACVEMISKANGTRILPLSKFITGVRETALAPDEIVTAVLIPAPAANTHAAFEKLGSRRYLVISITMSAVLMSCDDTGHITQARVAVGACSPVAKRLPALEASLIGQPALSAVIDPKLLSPLSPIDDVRGSAEYRLDVVAEQIARTVAKAAPHD